MMATIDHHIGVAFYFKIPNERSFRRKCRNTGLPECAFTVSRSYLAVFLADRDTIQAPPAHRRSPVHRRGASKLLGSAGENGKGHRGGNAGQASFYCKLSTSRFPYGMETDAPPTFQTWPLIS